MAEPALAQLQDASGGPLVDAVLDLGAVAMAFGLVDRTFCPHSDGSPESDTDHTVMLGLVACSLASLWPEYGLDVGLVSQFATVHDLPEVFCGDTPTLQLDEAGLQAKYAREADAARLLHVQFLGRLPWVSLRLAEYELQEKPEARFVRAVDKWLTRVVNILRECRQLHNAGIERDELALLAWATQERVAGYAGEFEKLMRLGEELIERMLEVYR
jgi:putative hydrolases of HD superfamily